MAFHFLDKDTIRKIISSLIRSNWNMQKLYGLKKKTVTKLERIRGLATKMMPDLEGIIYENT